MDAVHLQAFHRGYAVEGYASDEDVTKIAGTVFAFGWKADRGTLLPLYFYFYTRKRRQLSSLNRWLSILAAQSQSSPSTLPFFTVFTLQTCGYLPDQFSPSIRHHLANETRRYREWCWLVHAHTHSFIQWDKRRVHYRANFRFHWTESRNHCYYFINNNLGNRRRLSTGEFVCAYVCVRASKWVWTISAIIWQH